MYNALVSLLFVFIKDPEEVHGLAISFLKFLGTPAFNSLVLSYTCTRSTLLSQNLFGLHFENPVGLAAGLDKDGAVIPGLTSLGFGFLEVGTVTNESQTGNPRPRLFRIARDRAIINRMGFNNHGVFAMKGNLSVKRNIPVGISIGKSKTLPLESAPEDYLKAYSLLYQEADYIVVNVSSPNTPGLRDLQSEAHLGLILDRLNEYRAQAQNKKPILVKISPDLSYEAIDAIVDLLVQKNIDGVIATNTTITREGLSESSKEAGGLSGTPIKHKTTEIIRHIHTRAPKLPIIGVGGIMNPEDAYEKIKAGASLVQLYTGLIYEGPFVVRKINRGLIRFLKRDGYTHLSQAVGTP